MPRAQLECFLIAPIVSIVVLLRSRVSPLSLAVTFLSLQILTWTVCAQAQVTWKAEYVDPSYTEEFALTIDKRNNPHVVYQAFSEVPLRYATKSAGVWNISDLDLSTNVLSITTDARAVPHISHMEYSEQGRLWPRYTTRVGGQWLSQSVETPCSPSAVYSGLSIAFDNLGSVGVAYWADDYCSAFDGIKFARKPAQPWDAPWTIERVSDDEMPRDARTRVAFAVSGAPHICYVSDFETVRYATKSNGQWSVETIESSDAQGWGPAVAIDNLGRPVVSYVDNVNDRLVYAVKSGGVWLKETALLADVEGQTSIGTTQAGETWLGVRIGGTPAYARRVGSSWQTDEIGDVGGLTIFRLAAGPTGVPGIAYVDNGMVFASPTSIALPEDGNAKQIARADGLRLRWSPRAQASGAELRVSTRSADELAIEIYDASGRRVRSLPRLIAGAGDHAIDWDGVDENGHRAPQGVYFARVHSSQASAVAKFSLLR